MSISVSPEGLPDDAVPAGQRFLGLDKRTIPVSLISIALIAVFVGLLPAIDESLAYDREIEDGDVVELGAGLTFVPAEGWGFPSGMLVTDQGDPEGLQGATLTHDGISLSVITGPFTGTPEQLLEQVKKLNNAFGRVDGFTVLTDPEPITTDDGTEGVAQAFTGVTVEGVITTFVIDGVGIEFVVTAPIGSLAADDDTVPDMISSLRHEETGENR